MGFSMDKIRGIQEFENARAELRQLGVTLEILPGEYRVSLAGVGEASAYYTDDLDDATRAGRAMAANKPQLLPPLGPTGRKNTRRAMMYRHNARLAARRFGGAMILIGLRIAACLYEASNG